MTDTANAKVLGALTEISDTIQSKATTAEGLAVFLQEAGRNLPKFRYLKAIQLGFGTVFRYGPPDDGMYDLYSTIGPAELSYDGSKSGSYRWITVAAPRVDDPERPLILFQNRVDRDRERAVLAEIDRFNEVPNASLRSIATAQVIEKLDGNAGFIRELAESMSACVAHLERLL